MTLKFSNIAAAHNETHVLHAKDVTTASKHR